MIDRPNYFHIAEVAKHCDKQKLRIAEKQAWEYDLKEKLCDIWDRVEDDERLGKAWAMYSYARYVENSFYTDTASGFVRKDHSNSFPVQINELQAVANQYRNMGDIELRRLRNELCKERTGGDCFCGGHCKEDKTHTRIFEKKGKNISRYDLLQIQRGR